MAELPVKVMPLSTRIVPPWLPRVMPRLAFRASEAVARSVPPLMVS